MRAVNKNLHRKKMTVCYCPLFNIYCTDGKLTPRIYEVHGFYFLSLRMTDQSITFSIIFVQKTSTATRQLLIKASERETKLLFCCNIYTSSCQVVFCFHIIRNTLFGACTRRQILSKVGMFVVQNHQHLFTNAVN